MLREREKDNVTEDDLAEAIGRVYGIEVRREAGGNEHADASVSMAPSTSRRKDGLGRSLIRLCRTFGLPYVDTEKRHTGRRCAEKGFTAQHETTHGGTAGWRLEA